MRDHAEDLGEKLENQLGGPYGDNISTQILNDEQHWRYSVQRWRYYLKPGRSPTDQESAFCRQCLTLLDRIREFDRSKEHLSAQRDVILAFKSGLVHSVSTEQIETLSEQMRSFEADFVRKVVAPIHKHRINRAIAILLIIVLSPIIYHVYSVYVGQTDARIPGVIRQIVADFSSFAPYYYTIIGVLVGRILSLFDGYSIRIESFEDFYLRNDASVHPLFDAAIDIVVGVVACLVFVTGAIVITLGANAEDEAGLSTIAIRNNPEIAVLFGVLVGLVRASFLQRLFGFARTSAGSASPERLPGN